MVVKLGLKPFQLSKVNSVNPSTMAGNRGVMSGLGRKRTLRYPLLMGDLMGHFVVVEASESALTS
jgi:hypothetical protein